MMKIRSCHQITTAHKWTDYPRETEPVSTKWKLWWKLGLVIRLAMRQSLCFWLCIALTTHDSDWLFHGNLSKTVKMRQLLMAAQWEKESHWMRLIDLKDDKNFTLQNRWVAREESKVWALSLVPNYFSLSRPHLAFLMWGDTMYFHMHLHFARSTIPEGNWGTTHSLP